MEDIRFMILLGIAGGMIAGIWTRIIKKNMLFGKIGKKLERYNNNHLVMFNQESMTVKFLRCLFCLSVWLVLILELWYIVEYTPPFVHCLIGVIAGLGAGNFACEIIHALRNESL